MRAGVDAHATQEGSGHEPAWSAQEEKEAAKRAERERKEAKARERRDRERSEKERLAAKREAREAAKRAEAELARATAAAAEAEERCASPFRQPRRLWACLAPVQKRPAVCVGVGRPKALFRVGRVRKGRAFAWRPSHVQRSLCALWLERHSAACAQLTRS